MKRLTRLPQPVIKHDSQIIQIRGLDLSENYVDGSLSESMNISLDDYPVFRSRKPRQKVTGISSAAAITAWDDLIYISSGVMHVGNQVVDYTFQSGAKQFAMLQNKLVVWPDKVYVNMTTLDVVEMAQRHEPTYGEFGTNYLDFDPVSYGTDLTRVFNVGDTIRISNLEGEFAANNGWFTISAVETKKLTFDLPESMSFHTGTPSPPAVVERVIPDLAYIAVQNNRLWGVDNTEQAIWSSVQGDPCNFYTNKGISSDADAIPVSSAGDFTGIAVLGTQVLAFKTDLMYKVLGSYPAEYQSYIYHIEGVGPGCHKSLVVINDTLFYASANGIMAYSGASSMFIGAELGKKSFSNAVGGTDGKRYFLSNNGSHETFIYDTRLGMWIKEGDIRAVDYARIGSTLYALGTDGYVYTDNGGVQSITQEWSMTFNTFYESTTGSNNKKVMAYEKKRYHRIILRFHLGQYCKANVSVKFDGGNWEQIYTVTASGASYYMHAVPVMIRKCDHFSINISGRGVFELRQLVREFSLGGVR